MKPFDFRALDDLFFAILDGRAEQDLPKHKAVELGPVMELAFACEAAGLSPPSRAPWLHLDALASLVTATTNLEGLWIGDDGRKLGLMRLGRSNDDVATLQIARALQVAAGGVGFDKTISGQLAAAMRELIGNVEEHSESTRSGVAAFRATHDRMEMVVMDRGVGVLKSLSSARNYAELNDHLHALQLTLTEGVSRLDTAGRGQGFRPLFVGLADQEGVLRFRSGDGLIAIDGTLGPRIQPRTARRSNSRGLFISVDLRTSAQFRPAQPSRDAKVT